MNRVAVLTALLISITLYSVSWAADKATPDVAAQIAATLQERFPEVKIRHVALVPHLSGIYEVVTSSEIAYTDASADFLISGRLVETRTRRDLTALRWNELRRISFESLPFDLAIKTVKGDGSRRLAVFADPDCPYCQRLEHEMQGITNVTIYTFLYPLADLHPEAHDKAVRIWCAKDRAKAWSTWMLEHVAPPAADCGDQPIARLNAVGEQFDIRGTPTLYLANGDRIDGVITAAELEKRLAAPTAARDSSSSSSYK